MFLLFARHKDCLLISVPSPQAFCCRQKTDLLLHILCSCLIVMGSVRLRKMEPISEVTHKLLNLAIPYIAPLLRVFVFLKLFKSFLRDVIVDIALIRTVHCILLRNHLPVFIYINPDDTETDSHFLHSHHISTTVLLCFPVSVLGWLFFKLILFPLY